MNMPPPAIIMSALPKRSRCSSQSSDAGRWYAKSLSSASLAPFSSLVALGIGLVVDGGGDDHGVCDEKEWISSSTSSRASGRWALALALAGGRAACGTKR